METCFADSDRWNWPRIMSCGRLWDGWHWTSGFCCQCYITTWTFIIYFRKLIPLAVQCGVEGCTNVKKYCCSKTGMQLCSLECYRKNIARIKSLFWEIFKLWMFFMTFFMFVWIWFINLLKFIHNYNDSLIPTHVYFSPSRAGLDLNFLKVVHNHVLRNCRLASSIIILWLRTYTTYGTKAQFDRNYKYWGCWTNRVLLTQGSL
jgi:hypothetical protein